LWIARENDTTSLERRKVRGLAPGYANGDELDAAVLRKGLTFTAAMAKFRRI
jgi:hypothetical protein